MVSPDSELQLMTNATLESDHSSECSSSNRTINLGHFDSVKANSINLSPQFELSNTSEHSISSVNYHEQEAFISESNLSLEVPSKQRQSNSPLLSEIKLCAEGRNCASDSKDDSVLHMSGQESTTSPKSMESMHSEHLLTGSFNGSANGSEIYCSSDWDPVGNPKEQPVKRQSKDCLQVLDDFETQIDGFNEKPEKETSGILGTSTSDNTSTRSFDQELTVELPSSDGPLLPGLEAKCSTNSIGQPLATSSPSFCKLNCPSQSTTFSTVGAKMHPLNGALDDTVNSLVEGETSATNWSMTSLEAIESCLHLHVPHPAFMNKSPLSLQSTSVHPLTPTNTKGQSHSSDLDSLHALNPLNGSKVDEVSTVTSALSTTNQRSIASSHPSHPTSLILPCATGNGGTTPKKLNGSVRHTVENEREVLAPSDLLLTTTTSTNECQPTRKTESQQQQQTSEMQLQHSTRPNCPNATSAVVACSSSSPTTSSSSSASSNSSEDTDSGVGCSNDEMLNDLTDESTPDEKKSVFEESDFLKTSEDCVSDANTQRSVSSGGSGVGCGKYNKHNVDRTFRPLRKRQIHFGKVTVYYFSRAQGFTCVPAQGGSTLGMSPQHESVEQYSFSDYKRVRHCRKRQLLRDRSNSLPNLSLVSSECTSTDQSQYPSTCPSPAKKIHYVPCPTSPPLSHEQNPTNGAFISASSDTISCSNNTTSNISIENESRNADSFAEGDTSTSHPASLDAPGRLEGPGSESNSSAIKSSGLTCTSAQSEEISIRKDCETLQPQNSVDDQNRLGTQPEVENEVPTKCDLYERQLESETDLLDSAAGQRQVDSDNGTALNVNTSTFEVAHEQLDSSEFCVKESGERDATDSSTATESECVADIHDNVMLNSEGVQGGHVMADYDDNMTPEEVEDSFCLEVVPLKKRRKLLKESGIEQIDVSEHKECEWIRVSREDCGCSCRVVCDPRTCICALNGIKCQVDRQSYPCGCSKQGCGNQSGRIEFNLYRVRTHFFYTLLRLQQHRNNSVEPHAHLSSANNSNTISGNITAGHSKPISSSEGYGNSSDEEDDSAISRQSMCDSPDSLEDGEDDKQYEEAAGVIGERGECSNYCCLGVASRTTTYPDESHATMLQQYYCANGLGFNSTQSMQQQQSTASLSHASNSHNMQLTASTSYDMNYHDQAHQNPNQQVDCMLPISGSGSQTSNSLGQSSYQSSFSNLPPICSEDDLLNEDECEDYEGILSQSHHSLMESSAATIPVTTHPADHELCNDDVIGEDNINGESNENNEDSDYIVETEDDNFEVNVIDSPDHQHHGNAMLTTSSTYQSRSYDTSEPSAYFSSTSGFDTSQAMMQQATGYQITGQSRENSNRDASTVENAKDAGYTLPQMVTNYHSGFQNQVAHANARPSNESGFNLNQPGRNSSTNLNNGTELSTSFSYPSVSHNQQSHNIHAQCYPNPSTQNYHPSYASQEATNTCYGTITNTTIRNHPEHFQTSWFRSQSECQAQYHAIQAETQLNYASTNNGLTDNSSTNKKEPETGATDDFEESQNDSGNVEESQTSGPEVADCNKVENEEHSDVCLQDDETQRNVCEEMT